MRILFFCLTIVTIVSCNKPQAETPKPEQHAFAIAIHAGAGALKKGSYTPEEEALYHAKLKEAAQVGYDMLKRGDSATQVVVAVIKILEDSPLFNAGKGSVISNDGHIRMDASIMNGKTLDAGSINNVQTIKNPITAAKAVMEKSKYIMFTGAGAEAFAREQGIEFIDPSYFYTPRQVARWKEDKSATDEKTIHYVDSMLALQNGTTAWLPYELSLGTVGCAVKDKYGNLAAGTSTGGLMHKKFDRVGDSPVIGAGTYAYNKTCAISCTGTGEDFIKTVAAKTVSDMMEFKGMSLDEATHNMIHVRFKEITGDGGMVAVDANGQVSWQYNSDGMFRAFVNESGEITTAIY